MRLEETISAPFSLAQDVNGARAELERIDLAIRHEAIAEIQRAIQPQQDSLILLLESYGAASIRPFTVTNVIAAEVPPAILSALEADPNVAGVFPVTKLQPQLKFSVPNILAPTFWSAYAKGTGESVGVLDSGIDSSNPGFSGVKIVGKVFLSEGSTDPCFADNASTFNDLLGHGTHVSGIVASQGGGTCPTCIGVAPGIATLYALKIGWVASTKRPCTGGGDADDGDVLDAINWAVENTAVTVFNFSYGGPASGDDDTMSQLLDQIGDVWGVNIAIAAGNAGPGAGVESPGISFNGVTAASLDDQGAEILANDTVSGFSSRGPTEGGRFKPDIAAPGNHNNVVGGIYSTCNNGDYCQMQGTSMATPHVAGSLALIRSAGAPDGLAAKAVLLNTAYNAEPGWQAGSGWGFVDLSQAAAQANNYFQASVSAAQPAFYEGAVNGALQTTLAWNRHLASNLTPTFSNLSLYVYDGASGNTIGSSTSTIQNVQQVVATGVDTAVLEVAPVSIVGVASEPYGLAVSTAGFSAKNGPALTVSCTGPSGSVLINATFTVPCTVTNTGDLTAFTVSGTLNWQGSSGGTVNQFGNAGPGEQSGAQSWQIVAPSTTGPYTLEASVSSASYGQTFTATTTVAVTVTETYTLTTAVSPSNTGVITPAPAATDGVYLAGTEVCLTATPNSGWAFSSWSGSALNSSNCLVMNGNASVTATFVPAPLYFVPMTPCRVADTRYANGAFGSPSLASGSTRSFTIPSGSCGIPTTAAAFSLNVTVVPPGPLDYLTVWPSGAAQPLVSTLNSVDGRTKANAAIIPAGTSGAVSVYATNTTDLILDIDGYFVPAGSNASALAFYPLTPCRIADTRYSSFGSLGPPSLSAGQSRSFAVLSSTCSVPSTAQAYSLNFTVVPPGTSPVNYVTTYPTGATQPLASTLNDMTGTIVANAAIVPAGTGGAVDVYTYSATDLVIDINGYFAPPGTGGLSLYNLIPCRVLDSRLPTGTPPFTGELDVNVTGSGCGTPTTAQSYVFNATVAPPAPMNYLTLWPQGGTMPVVSTLNALDGAITSNMALVPTTNGSISSYVYVPTTTYLILDVFGYFAP